MKLFPTKRGWIRIGVGLTILAALALIANGFMAWRTEARLQAKIAIIRAAGDPVSIADLAPKAIPADKNAAAILERTTSALDAFAKEHTEFYSSPAGKDFDDRQDAGKPPTAEQLTRIRSMLDKYPTILPALTDAVAQEEYASLLNFDLRPSQFMEELFPRVSRIRTLTRYVDWKMTVLNSDEKRDEAVDLGIQILKLSRLYDHEPMQIHFLVSIAIRGVMLDKINTVLRSGPVNAETRKTLDSELTRQDDLKALAHAFRSERAFAIDATIEQVHQMPSLIRWPMYGFYFGELDMLDRGVASSDRPWFEIRDQWDKAYVEEKAPFRLAGLGEWSPIGEALRAVFIAEARRTTINRCLRIVNALGAYQDRTGKEATSLEQLDLPADAVVDPWSGKPLQLKWSDRGWLVYSVWLNGVDDRGHISFTEGDWGLVPIDYPKEW